MAATAAEIPRERDLLSRLAAGTAGVVGAEFLRRLVAELAARAGRRGRVRRRADRATGPAGRARSPAPASRGIELREGHEFALAGTPCEHAYQHELLLVRRGARLRYPGRPFLRRHQLDGYLAIALRDADGRPIGHIGVITARPLDPPPSELQALQRVRRPRRRRARAPPPRAALRLRTDEVAASRARAVQAADEERRRIGRDLHDGAQQRLVVLGQALDLALRELEPTTRAGASSASPPRASRPRSPAASCASWPAACIRSGSSAGLRAALAALAVQSPLPLRIDALPERRLAARGRGDGLVPRLRGALERDQARGRDRAARVRRPARAHARRRGRRRRRAAAPAPRAAPACRGSRRASSRSAAALEVDSPHGAGTTLTATIPLAPWRTARRPLPRVRPRRRRRPRPAQDRRGRSPARAPPASRSRASGSSRAARRGSASACPSSTTPAAGTGSWRSCASRSSRSREVDPASVDPEPGDSDWHTARARAYDECREEIAALLGEPDWRLTGAEPMVILTYRAVPAAPISGSIR